MTKAVFKQLCLHRFYDVYSETNDYVIHGECKILGWVNESIGPGYYDYTVLFEKANKLLKYGVPYRPGSLHEEVLDHIIRSYPQLFIAT